MNNFGFIHVLLLVNKFPASENRRSLAVEVAETAKYFWAKLLKIGNLSFFSFYQISEFDFIGISYI